MKVFAGLLIRIDTTLHPVLVMWLVILLLILNSAPFQIV